MKRVFVLLVGGMTLCAAVNAGAWEEAQGIRDASGSAASSANSGNYEGAREGAGTGFDGNTYNPTPVVDLSGKQGVVDPRDLKQYDPEPRSLKPSYVPPLP